MDQLAPIANTLTKAVNSTNGKLIPSIPIKYSIRNEGIHSTLKNILHVSHGPIKRPVVSTARCHEQCQSQHD